MNSCGGGHEIYVAECLYIAKDGKLIVVTVCRRCDTVKFHNKEVTNPHTPAEFLKFEQKGNEQ